MTRGLKIAATDVTESAEVQRITGLLPQSGKTPEQCKDEIRKLAGELKLPVDRVCSPIKHRQVVRGAARDVEAFGERIDEDYVELVWGCAAGLFTLGAGSEWPTLSTKSAVGLATSPSCA
jgi:hypothetical protein